ncbi:deoxyribonuclease IV [Thermoplasmatales archaeon ex4484_36]|nr:MAG: deoxyribonuclease IV [Thermoplasmatales archaeon ex4484_36]RLF55643.1 MAG: deoxyribonuclease IV [Thermoplasmata archaeon]HDD59448.1 deoxyribonuclease IV [Euryarchaeota archaeon]RLF71460.1 MAG: deoxyribonuclease IV [Thermoplasmata archaeon]RLF73080.1 MAG: deoxyribonuclease IV [Thermoplasmata archaeon]
MGLLGAHVSTQGGVQNAPERGASLQCDAIAIFTKNQRQWRAKPLKEEEIEGFKENMKRFGIEIALSHDSYLINLGSPKEEIYRKSVEAFVDEIVRADQLDLPYLVFHPGSHLGEGEEWGLKKIAEGIEESLSRAPESRVMLLLETTAGQGTNLGYTFEQLAAIMDMVGDRERLGVCFDTCHAFAAGYDIRTPEAYGETFDRFEEVIGLRNLKAFHLNDSKFPLGSKKDRHEHIGEGEIGIEAFRLLVNDRRFEEHPMILETPGGDVWYSANLKVLRDLIQ